MVWFRLVVDFTEKNIFNSLIAFSFWKAFTFTSFERFLCCRSKLLPALFSRNFLKSWIVNYWGSIFTLYLKWGAFSLVCVLSVLFFFFLSSFSSLFYRYFPWQTLRIHRTAGNGKGIIIFLIFHFHPLTNIHLVHLDFLPLYFNRSFCNYQTDETCWWPFSK